ncbi:MAG: ribonucleoside triphosphate reductase [Candidatus Woesearchaeota archaeon]
MSEIFMKIEKRDGSVTDFNRDNITEAIFQAAKAVGGHDRETSIDLTEKVLYFMKGSLGKKIPNVEDVQDAVEQVLIEEGHAKTAKAYILHREQHKKLRENKKIMFDVVDVMDGYLRQSDWRVNENSNMNYSHSGLLLHIAGSVIANYTLNNVYPSKIAEAHKKGDFHIHDLSMGIAGYCAGWSIRQVLEEGFNGVAGKTSSKPPKHFGSALWQLINFLGTLQNEWAGAMAFSSFDTYLAPFVKSDNMSYREVKQNLQGFVFNMNVPTRWGGQTPFSNITLDWVIPKDMREKKPKVGGIEQDFTYQDCQDEADLINKAFMEIMMEGDSDGRVFTFPIPTYNITKDFDWDSDNAKLLFQMTSKYGTPYFQNFINSTLDPGDVRSMCCRLQMDMRELKQRGGGLFGSVEMTGSVGVVTINLPRIGYNSKDKEELFNRIENLMELAKESLEIKRKVINSNLENGLLPYTKRYLGTLDNHFSTIGLVGMNEMLRNFLSTDITSKEGQQFAKEVLSFMRERLKDFQEETGHIYNLEATPAEGTAYRLARKDKELYPEILTAGEEEPYYTNSTQLPVGYTQDIFEALELQDELQSMYTGGTVMHGFMGEKVSDEETCKELVKKIAYNFTLPYFTITPTFSICKEHGYISGEYHECPTCSSATEVYSRVVGYHRPVQNWNKGKKEEFKDRSAFTEDRSFSNSIAKSELPEVNEASPSDSTTTKTC